MRATGSANARPSSRPGPSHSTAYTDSEPSALIMPNMRGAVMLLALALFSMISALGSLSVYAVE